MGIGIGLHCWFCDHGPCNHNCTNPLFNGELRKDDKKEIRDKKIKIILKQDSNRAVLGCRMTTTPPHGTTKKEDLS